MVAATETTIRYDGNRLSDGDVRSMASQIAAIRTPRQVCIDLGRTTDTTLGALARLVQLRGTLLRVGRDLRIVGLQGRAEGLYDIHRMGELLPRQPRRSDPGTS